MPTSPDHLSTLILTSGILACSTLVVWMAASTLRRLGRPSMHPGSVGGKAPGGRRPASADALPDLDRFARLVEGLAAAEMEAAGQPAPEATRDLAVDLLERLGGTPEEMEALRGRLDREASRSDAPRPPRALVERLRLMFRPAGAHSAVGRPVGDRAAAGRSAGDSATATSAAAEPSPDGSTENRLLFVSFEQEIRTAERRKAPLTLLDLRIEGFDAFEERFGRAATDRILRGVARAVRSQLRPDDKLVRDAGGAFLVIVPGLAAEGVRSLAARIESATARHKFALERGRSVAVEASVCAATFPQDGRSYDALLTVVRTRRALAPKGSVVPGPSSGPWRPYPHRIDAPVN